MHADTVDKDGLFCVRAVWMRRNIPSTTIAPNRRHRDRRRNPGTTPTPVPWIDGDDPRVRSGLASHELTTHLPCQRWCGCGIRARRRDARHHDPYAEKFDHVIPHRRNGLLQRHRRECRVERWQPLTDRLLHLFCTTVRERGPK